MYYDHGKCQGILVKLKLIVRVEVEVEVWI